MLQEIRYKVCFYIFMVIIFLTIKYSTTLALFLTTIRKKPYKCLGVLKHIH